MGINKNTLRQRARDLLNNMWSSILLFRELPVGRAENLEDEIFLMEHRDTGGGTRYRPTRIPLSQLFSSLPADPSYDEGSAGASYLPSEEFDEGDASTTYTADETFDGGDSTSIY